MEEDHVDYSGDECMQELPSSEPASQSHNPETSESGYYEDKEGHTFGTQKKERKRPLSNFSFTFVKKVVSRDPASTGFLVEVSPERVGDESGMEDWDIESASIEYHGRRTRLCFFTSESTMKKDRFMQQLNRSYGEGGLTCGFNDYQLAEFIQQKLRREGRITKAIAVEMVGPQADGTWVLGQDLYIDDDGRQVSSDVTRNIWIGHWYSGPGIAPNDTSCQIPLPLSSDPLRSLIDHMSTNLAHNFYPALLVVGSFAMALHYQTILSRFLFCPIPLAYGASGTGKTTALRCGLSIVGASPQSHPSRFYSKGSVERYTDLSSQSYLPFAIDDPKSKNAISDLTIALFNGANATTFKRGDTLPLNMPVISANFTTSEEAKYITRCALIEFFAPRLDVPAVEYTQLPALLKESTRSIGLAIGLGKKFVEVGIKEMDDKILPQLRQAVGKDTMPRVFHSYAMLLWFTIEIIRAAGMGHLEEALIAHFKDKMAPSITRLQGEAGSCPSVTPTPTKQLAISLDEVAEEILDCCHGLELYDIWSFMRTDTDHCKQKVLSIRPDAVPKLRPSSVKFIMDATKCADKGCRSKKEFLITKPTTEIQKVNRNVGKTLRCIVLYMSVFRADLQQQLYQITSHSKLDLTTSESGSTGGQHLTQNSKQEDPTKDDFPMADLTLEDLTKDDLTHETSNSDELSNEGLAKDQSTEGNLSSEDLAKDQSTEGDLSSEDLTKDQSTEGDLSSEDLTKEQSTEGDLSSEDLTKEQSTKGDLSSEDLTKEQSTKGDLSSEDLTKDLSTKGDVTSEDLTKEQSTKGDVTGEDLAKEQEERTTKKVLNKKKAKRVKRKNIEPGNSQCKKTRMTRKNTSLPPWSKSIDSDNPLGL